MTDAEDAAPPLEMPALPPLRPPLDPRALRDRTVADYMRNMGAPGMPTTADEIERLAVADLNLSDAYARDEPPVAPPTPEQRAARKAEADAAVAEQVRRDGMELTRNKPRELGPQFDLPADYAASLRWRLAKGRLGQILAGASPPKRFPDGSFDFRSMTATCECPAQAYDFLAAWFNFDLRHVPETARHNPFFGMSHRDASLKLARLVEDLADASTGKLGAWFAK